MSDKCFLTISNSTYIPVAEKLVSSAFKYHPEILFEFYGINLSENDIIKLKKMHNNLKVYNHEKEFDDVSLEALYASSICRPLFIKKSMDEEYDVLYLDGDMVIKDNLDDLFYFVDDYDFVVNPSRSIKSKEFRCNAGLIWIKNNRKTINIVNEWQDVTVNFCEDGNPDIGLAWYSEQHALDKMIEKYHFDKNEITYASFLNDHLSERKENRNSLIVHNKGPKDKPDSYPGKAKRFRAKKGTKLDVEMGISFK